MSTENHSKPSVPQQLIDEDFHQRAQHADLLAREKSDADARKNFNFVQVEKTSLRELRRLIDRSPNAAKILFILAEKMNRENALICSFKALEQITGLSRTTLSNAVSLLKKEQWLQVIKVGTANAYIVNNRVFWQNAGNKKHAYFNAAIIATSDEQDESVEDWDNVALRRFPMMTIAAEGQVLNTVPTLKPKAKVKKDVDQQEKDHRQINWVDDVLGDENE